MTAKLPQKNTDKKQRWRWLVPSTGVIVFAAVIATWLWWTYSGEAFVTRYGMERYLEGKYQKSFAVGDVHVSGSGIGMPGIYMATAKSNIESKVEFSVSQERHFGAYHDTYWREVFNNRESGQLAKQFTDLFAKEAAIIGDSTIAYELENTLDGSATHNLDDLIREYPKDVMYGIKVIVRGDKITDDDVLKLQELVKYAKTRNEINYSVRYVVNMRTEDARLLCQLYGGDENGRNSQSASKDCFTKHEGREE